MCKGQGKGGSHTQLPATVTIAPQVFRAPTDNDKSFGNWLAKDWKRCGLDSLIIPMTTQQEGNKLTFTFSIPEGLPELPRLGIVIELPREYEQLTWYGRGPWDNYPDRKTSCPIGLWQSTVSQQYVHYPRPQDSGNHEDCTLIELRSNKGKSIRIEAVDNPFSFSALFSTVSGLKESRLRAGRPRQDLPQHQLRRDGTGQQLVRSRRAQEIFH